MASSSTAATRRYFQRGYSSISGALERALGHELRDLGLLHLDAHAVGDLERDEGLADVGDLAQQSPARHHLIAGGQLGEQVLVFLGALLLRPKQQEVEDDEEHAHHQKWRELARATGGGLRP